MIDAPKLEELSFEENTHEYRLDGETIPSVTTIMKPLAESLYAGIGEKTLNAAAYKGTAVHNAIENWLKFGIVDIPSEYKVYLDAFLGWWDKTKPEVIASEMRLYHKLLRYAGTADLLCLIDGKVTLVDYKSTSVVSEMTCGVQLEAYSQAMQSHGFKIERKEILHIQKNGIAKEYEFPSRDPARWRVFGSLKTVYDYVKSYK